MEGRQGVLDGVGKSEGLAAGEERKGWREGESHLVFSPLGCLRVFLVHV